MHAATVRVIPFILLLLAAPVRALVIADPDFDPANYDVLEIETGDVTPVPQPDGIGRTSVIRATPGRSGVAGDGFARIEIEGYNTTGSTGYGQIAVVVLKKGLVGAIPLGGFASIRYSESSMLITGGGQGQATGVAIRQGSNVYIATVESTPERAWTPKSTGAGQVTPAEFSLLEGPGPSAPDLAAPFQIGFFRANSGPAPSGGGVRVSGLDDLLIVLDPACTTPADCVDDGDGCSTETCTGGLCSGPPVACASDGNPCTSDACDPADGSCPYATQPDGTSCADNEICNGEETCVAGACTPGTPPTCDDGNPCTRDLCLGECKNYGETTFELVDTQIKDFLTRISGPACSGDPLVKKLRTKLKKAIAKVRMRVRKADAKTKSAAIIALLGKAGDLVDAARALLTGAVASGDLSGACGAELDDFLRSLDQCITYLPKAP